MNSVDYKTRAKQKFLIENQRLKTAFLQLAVAAVSATTMLALNSTPAKALILDPARTALEADLTASGFADPQIVGIMFGLMEFILIVVPIATGAMAVSQMSRGSEAWLPWAQVMGGSLVLIAFITAIVTQVYG